MYTNLQQNIIFNNKIYNIYSDIMLLGQIYNSGDNLRMNIFINELDYKYPLEIKLWNLFSNYHPITFIEKYEYAKAFLCAVFVKELVD